MYSTTIHEFKRNTQKYIDQVTYDSEVLIINGAKNKKAVVLLSLDEYCSLDATMHELSSKANKEVLDRSIREIERGNVFYRDLIEE